MRYYFNILTGVGLILTGASFIYAGLGHMNPHACNCYAWLGISIGIILITTGIVVSYFSLNIKMLNWKYCIIPYIKSAEFFSSKRLEELKKESKEGKFDCDITEFSRFGIMFCNGLGVSKAFERNFIYERILILVFNTVYGVACNEYMRLKKENKNTIEAFIYAYERGNNYLKETIFDDLNEMLSLDEFDKRGFKNYQNFESVKKQMQKEKTDLFLDEDLKKGKELF